MHLNRITAALLIIIAIASYKERSHDYSRKNIRVSQNIHDSVLHVPLQTIGHNLIDKIDQLEVTYKYSPEHDKS